MDRFDADGGLDSWVSGTHRRGRIAGPAEPVGSPGSVGEFAAELVDIALGGEGWHAILHRIAAATGLAARLIGVHGGVFHATDDGDATMTPAEVARVFAEADEPGGAGGSVQVALADGWKGRALPVWAGRRRVGLVLLAEPVPEPVLPYLAASATAVAIEAVRRDAAAAARAETAGRFIDDLRYGAPAGEVTRAAERFGLRLDRPHAAAVFAYEGPNRRTWSTALSWLEMPVRQEGAEGWTALSGVDVAREVTRIRTRLQGMVGEVPVLAAAGPVVAEPGETARSFREAEVVLGLLRRRPDETELLHSSLGLTQLLLGVPPDRLRGFVEQQLGPILDRPELVATLDAWLAARGSRAAVADLLHLHRNSVGYRVGQIRQLLGSDPLDPATATSLRTALTARELLHVFSEKPERNGRRPGA
jgi:hypothetical protein